MSFHSQFGEDKWIIENLHPPERGTFCEVGAFDGVEGSNTLAFEEMGWSGILVEPNPLMASQCIQNRRAEIWTCAAGLETHGDFNLHMEHMDWSGFKSEGRPIKTLIKRLDWLLIASGYPNGVGLLSIDTEGTELEVWESIGIFRPRIVIVEYLTAANPPQDKLVLERFTADGYHEVHRTQCNLIFEHGSRA